MNVATNPTSTTTPHYWLARHVYVCATRDGIIALDLKRDRYFGLADSQSSELATLVPGWPSERAGASAPHAEAYATAEALVRQGMLTRDRACGKPAIPVRLERITMMARGDRSEHRGRIGPGHLLHFLFACARAAVALKWRGLQGAVQGVQTRKQRHAARSSASVDIDVASALAGAFRRMQVYAYARQNRCVFDTLALLNFLAAYQQFPLWVIGIRTRSFGAHSWVQHGAWVFDAYPEEVCEYTPILAV